LFKKIYNDLNEIESFKLFFEMFYFINEIIYCFY